MTANNLRVHASGFRPAARSQQALPQLQLGGEVFEIETQPLPECGDRLRVFPFGSLHQGEIVGPPKRGRVKQVCSPVTSLRSFISRAVSLQGHAQLPVGQCVARIRQSGGVSFLYSVTDRRRKILRENPRKLGQVGGMI